MENWLRADAEGRVSMLAEVRVCFLTDKGTMRTHYTQDKGAMSSCLAAAERIVAAVDELLATASAMQVADELEIGRAHVCTPVTNAQLVCRLLLVKKKNLIKHCK